jgi:osmotically-inducible protein OsmY
MTKVLRAVLGLAAGAMVLVLLEKVARQRQPGASVAARALLSRLRPRPVDDETVAVRVRRKLARTARDPDAIRVTIEHGCVDLRGRVATRERARIVQAVARVRGVDSVIDLMTEPKPDAWTSR